MIGWGGGFRLDLYFRYVSSLELRNITGLKIHCALPHY